MLRILIPLLFFTATCCYSQPFSEATARNLAQRELGGVVDKVVGARFKSGSYFFVLHRTSRDDTPTLVVARSFANRYSVIWKYTNSPDYLSPDYARNLSILDLDNDGYPEVSWEFTDIAIHSAYVKFFILSTKDLQAYWVSVRINPGDAPVISVDPALQKPQYQKLRNYLETKIEVSGYAKDDRSPEKIMIDNWIPLHGKKYEAYGIYILSPPLSLPKNGDICRYVEPNAPEVVLNNKLYRAVWRSGLIRIDRGNSSCEMLIYIYANYTTITTIAIKGNLLLLTIGNGPEGVEEPSMLFDPVRLVIR